MNCEEKIRSYQILILMMICADFLCTFVGASEYLKANIKSNDFIFIV